MPDLPNVRDLPEADPPSDLTRLVDAAERIAAALEWIASEEKPPSGYFKGLGGR